MKRLRKFSLCITFVFVSTLMYAQTTVTGTVLDATDGLSLIGTAVCEKGTRNAVITDIDGNFTIKVKQGATLVFSYVDYEQQELPAQDGMKVMMRPVSAPSLVDLNIPAVAQTDRNTFAVIIGNEKYRHEAEVPFAENDAKIMKEYVQKTIGVPEEQIRLVENAGYNDIRMAVNWLSQAMKVCRGKGKAIFYYAGHGIPDEKDKSAYLLPVDGIGNDPASAYSLKELYDRLGEMDARSVAVFLDACFSGAKREGGMMASARGIAIKARQQEAKGKMVIFCAAQGDETAYPYQSQQHGMFTYFLLRKLKETNGNVTFGELSDYLSEEVGRQSFIVNNKMQTPTVNAASALSASWRQMRLR